MSLKKVFLYGLIALIAVIVVTKFIEAAKPPSAEMIVLRTVETQYLPSKSDSRKEVDRNECETNWKNVKSCDRTIYNNYNDSSKHTSIVQEIDNRLAQDDWKSIRQKRDSFSYQKNISGYEICALGFVSKMNGELQISFSTGEKCW